MAGNNLLLAKILRDSNTTQGGENALAEQFPRVYGALRGLLGTAPDEVGGSVLDGSHQAQSSGANVGFPLGLLAQMLPAAKLTKGLPVGMSIKSVDGPLSKFVYPQEQALQTAQRNAALPVEQGGLGLHPQNTPMERAQAMGMEQTVFRGTNANEAQHSGNVWVTNEPNAANYYTGFVNQDDVYPMLNRHEGGNVMPMLGDNSFIHPDNAEPLWNGGDRFHVPAQTLRSRFASFDPMRRYSPDILAGLLPLSSMADQDTRNKLAGLLQP
jgi:hypothetical protein